jgi:hypothetical protein
VRACASPGYLRRHGRPQDAGDLAGHACLRFPLPGFRSRWRFRDQGGAEQDVAVAGRIIISNALGLLDCALADAGVVLLAEVMLADALRDGRLVDLFPDHEVTATDFDSAAWFVYPSRDYLPLKVRVFVQALREAVQHRMAGAALAGQAAPPQRPLIPRDERSGVVPAGARTSGARRYQAGGLDGVALCMQRRRCVDLREHDVRY